MTVTARFRERISIQAKNLIDNGKGGRTRPVGEPEWLDVASNVSAEIVPMRGDEAVRQSIIRSIQLYRVTIHARTGVTTAHRLLWKTAPLNIKAMQHSIDRRSLMMTCEAGLPD